MFPPQLIAVLPFPFPGPAMASLFNGNRGSTNFTKRLHNELRSTIMSKHSKLAVAILAGSLALGGSAQAANNEANNPYMDSHVTGGFGAGAVIGTLLGGPIGTVVGALGGALVGEQVAIKHELGDENLQASNTIAGLKTHLAGTQAENAELKAQQAAMADQVARLSSKLNNGTLAGSFGMDVLFRTGSGKLEPRARDQLRELARTLQRFPEMQVHLAGFADRRGDTQRNLALSSQRAEAVKQALTEAGVPAGRIDLSYFGEARAKAKAGDIDGLALDRRVSIELKAERTAEADPAVVSGVVSR